MRNRDLLSSFFWLGFGVLFLIGAVQQGLIRKGIPGPGFLPFIVGAILVFLSLLVFISALLKKPEEKTNEKTRFFPEKGGFLKISLSIGALFAYGVALLHAGFILTTFVFMLFMSRLIEPRKWVTVFILAILTAVLSYLLFFALEVQLPTGVLGI